MLDRHTCSSGDQPQRNGPMCERTMRRSKSVNSTQFSAQKNFTGKTKISMCQFTWKCFECILKIQFPHIPFKIIIFSRCLRTEDLQLEAQRGGQKLRPLQRLDDVLKELHGGHYTFILSGKEHRRETGEVDRETGQCLPAGQFFTFWQVSINSSIVTTPSLLRSIFWGNKESRNMETC